LGYFFAPKGSRGLSPGFQPREPRPKASRPEGAADGTHQTTKE
jgi:hypothetical protein